MNRRVLIAMLATAVLLPVLAGVVVYSLLKGGGSSSAELANGPSAGVYKGSEPPGEIRLPSFALRDHKGRVIRSDELRGKVTLVTFLDTDCMTKCPLIAAQIGDGLRLLTSRERRDLAPLAISVNPASDTSRTAHAFLKARQTEQLDFLLGTTQTLRSVWRSFHIVSAAETGNADIHSADVRIFNRRGIWVSTQHAGIDLTPSNLAYDIRVALRADQDLTTTTPEEAIRGITSRP